MPTTSHGHTADKFPKVKIDEQLWQACQKIVPPNWHAWSQACLRLAKNFGVPTEFAKPFFMGRIPDLSGQYPQGLKVFMIDGNKVMTDHDMDFNQGANGREDPDLCGKGEVVLDANILLPMPEDLPFIAYHEGIEQSDMYEGMSYDKAHVLANAGERQLRLRA